MVMNPSMDRAAVGILSENERGLAPAPARTLHSHLTPLYGAEWSVWNWICLRGAGFPSHWVGPLAAPGAAHTADSLFRAEIARTQAIDHAASVIRSQLNTSDELVRKNLYRSLKRLNKGQVPEGLDQLPSNARHELQAAQGEVQQALERFRSEFQREVDQISHAICKVAQEDRFQRAVLLQNAGALRRVLHGLQSSTGATQKRPRNQRLNEEFVASYLQRYCMKNDSIGFFGPIGWAKFVAEGDAIASRPGPSLTETSTIYFEQWCIEALAEKISESEAIRPWIAPRPSPLFYLDGARLYLPGGSSHILSPAQAAVLSRCDGERTARQITQELIGLSALRLRTEVEVYLILKHLADRHIISWKLELPLEVFPESRLRRLLQKIEKDDLRMDALNALDELEAARDQVALSLNNAGYLDHALNRLEEVFSKSTGKAPSRASGKMYAGRTLVYNDCRRGLQLEVGPDLVRTLGEPLSLILAGARWFTYRAAELYRQEFLRTHQKLISTTKASSIDALSFWMSVQDLLLDPERRLFDRMIPEFQGLWQRILRVPWDQNRVCYSSDELRPQINRYFNAPRPGWQAARYHSPDVMIAAVNAEAIRSGDYLLVLGELHLAVNTVRKASVMSQHPSPEEMFQAITLDLPGPHISPVPPRSWPGLTTRTSIVLLPDNHVHVEIAPEAASPGLRSRTLPLSAFVVESSGNDIVVRTRDRRLSWDVVEFLGEVLSLQAVDCMKMLPPQLHTPRITIDRLVVSRECWRVPVSDLPFLNEPEESARFLATRRWQQQLQLPRFVFVKVHVEEKPFYLDFDSPVYVGLFLKMMRRVLASDRPHEQALISEMLPTPDRIWLSDSTGQKYTSELRIVVSDQTLN